jgi:hypothetical protein
MGIAGIRVRDWWHLRGVHLAGSPVVKSPFPLFSMVLNQLRHHMIVSVTFQAKVKGLEWDIRCITILVSYDVRRVSYILLSSAL